MMASLGMLGSSSPSSSSSSPRLPSSSSPPRSPLHQQNQHQHQQQQQQQSSRVSPDKAKTVMAHFNFGPNNCWSPEILNMWSCTGAFVHLWQRHLWENHSYLATPLRFPILTSEAPQHSNSRWVVRSTSTTDSSRRLGDDQMLVYVPPHPLIKHWISVLRNELSPPPIFKSALAELGRYLIYEASRDWLTTVTGEVQTPCGVANVEFIDPRDPVRVIPILRAGLVLVEHISTVLPATQTYHVGFQRDESTLQPSLYLNKLPEKFPDNARVIVADPMLATGGTMVATLNLLKERNVNHKLIRVVSAVAAPRALKLLGEKFPGLRVYTGIIDPSSLNEQGYIVPGLGDAGDRSYGTYKQCLLSRETWLFQESVQIYMGSLA